MTPVRRATIEFLLDNLVWLMLIVVLIVFSLTVPRFFQFGIFANIIEQSTFVGVMAIGLAIVIISGNLDLSVESTAALAAMVTGLLFATQGIGLGIALEPAWLILPVSLAIAMLVGAAVGMANGFFVVRLGMSAFIVTLASFIWVRGLVVAISGGRSAQSLPAAIRVVGTADILGLPLLAWISVGCFVLFSFIMAKTPFGRYVTLVGGNLEATYRAGINSNRILFV